MVSVNIKDKDVSEVVTAQGKRKFQHTALSARDWDMQTLSYEELRTSFKKGLRNRNWRKRKSREKALFRASLWYAKHRGSIVKALLVEKLLGLVERLKETKGMKIFKKGFKKAVEMLDKYEENGVFTWAPQLEHWLKDSDYIFWLGTVR